MARREESELLDSLTNLSNIRATKKGARREIIYSDKKISVSELSDAIKTVWESFKKNRIVKYFWQEGNLITSNDKLSPEMIESYCKSINFSAKFEKRKTTVEIILDYFQKTDKQQEVAHESPMVVSVMGHIDHGKSTLLDTIRETNFQKQEEGGITQKVSVRPLTFKGKQITFLDTPGHELFLAMRERGASITDLVVLVIEGSDGVMPQTEEVINHIHNHKMPVLVFINNKSKEKGDIERNLNKIMSQLQERNLTPVEWGGDVIIVSGSAIQKQSAQVLLENIDDISTLYSRKTNLKSACRGVVLDSYISHKEGKTTTLLVKDGTLNVRDTIFVNGQSTKVKALENFSASSLKKAFPGDIVKAWGIDLELSPGEEFVVINDEKLVRKITKVVPLKKTLKDFTEVDKVSLDEKENYKIFNLVLVSDSPSSLEVLQSVVKRSSNEKMIFNTVYLQAGTITDSLINIAKITGSSFVAFNVKIGDKTLTSLRENKIKIVESSIIYEIEEKLEKLANSLIERKKVEKVIGISDVIRVFQFSEVGSIAGCIVKSGTINKNHLINVFRGDKKILSAGKIASLQKDKKTVKEASKGQECGVVLNNFREFAVHDQIVSYSMVDEDDSKITDHKNRRS